MPTGRLRILRYRTIVQHVTPTRREITEEITFYNDTDNPAKYIILHAHAYRPGMKIVDQDGTLLGFFPNEIVRGLLKQSGDPDDLVLLSQLDRHEKYIQWIPLPTDDPVAPSETRVITISYTDSILPRGRFGSRAKIVFNIPEFDVKKTTPSSEPFPSNITVIAPEGARINVEEHDAKTVMLDSSGGVLSSRELLASDHYYLTKSDNIVDISLPHIKGWEIRFHLVYGIYPDRSEQKALEVLVSGLLAASTALLIFAVLQLSVASALLQKNGIFLPNPAIRSQISPFATTVVLVSLAFIGLTTNPLAQRTKFWVALPVVLCALAVIFSTVLT